MTELPYITADLPGVGGVLRHTEDDFRVDEALPYEPSGDGDHLFVRIEKRGLTTPQAAQAIARALDINARDIGWAGMKDKRAVTRQTLSLPPPCTPEAVSALQLPDMAILSVTRHRHKLRTGHVRENRFVLRLRQLDVDEDTAAARATAIMSVLTRPPGSPNWFGAQRFGATGDNADIGRALVTGTPLPRGMRKPRGRKLRFYISALQSQLFNEYLQQRMTAGAYRTVLAGDILQKRESGGSFVSEQLDVDQARLHAGEVVPTGPMFGHKVMLPPPDSDAGVRERAVLASHELSKDTFARVGKLGTGTRRPLAISLGETAVTTCGERAIELVFSLPAGAYATAVVREVVKGADSFPR